MGRREGLVCDGILAPEMRGLEHLGTRVKKHFDGECGVGGREGYYLYVVGLAPGMRGL